MTSFIIDPFEGAGPIRFGMGFNEVRSIIGEPYESFKRTPTAAFPCDHFIRSGIFCYYDSEGLLEAIEFYDHSKPEIVGIDIIGNNFGDICKEISEYDNQMEIESDGLIAYQLGISLYAPFAKDNKSALVESAIAFRRGYYN